MIKKEILTLTTLEALHTSMLSPSRNTGGLNCIFATETRDTSEHKQAYGIHILILVLEETWWELSVTIILLKIEKVFWVTKVTDFNLLLINE